MIRFRGFEQARQLETGKRRTSLPDRKTWQPGFKTRRPRDARCCILKPESHHPPSKSDPFIAGLTLNAGSLLSALTEPHFPFCRHR